MKKLAKVLKHQTRFINLYNNKCTRNQLRLLHPTTKASIGTELVKITSYSFQVCCDSDRKVIEDAEIGWEWDFYFPIIE